MMKKLVVASWVLMLVPSWAASVAFGQPKVIGEPVLKEIGKRGGQAVISVSDPKSFNPITTWSPPIR
jgi:hypothetical protein